VLAAFLYQTYFCTAFWQEVKNTIKLAKCRCCVFDKRTMVASPQLYCILHSKMLDHTCKARLGEAPWET